MSAGLKGLAHLPAIIVLSIVLEPLRWLTRWFMRRSSVERRARSQHRRRSAPLCDLVWLEASPVTRVLQYLSSLLTGRAKRLCLLWGRSHNSFSEWSESKPDELDMLRRCCLCAASWVHVRHMQTSMSYPWMLAGIADARRPLASRRSLAEAFYHEPKEILDDWFGAPLQNRHNSSGELLDQAWQEALWLWSWQVNLSIAQVEFAHGRNRARSNEHETWENFVAHSFNSESALRVKRQFQALSSVGSQAPKLAPPRVRQQRRPRKRSAKDVLRFELMGANKALGLKVSVASPGFWQQVNSEWESAQQDPARMCRLQLEADRYNTTLEERPPREVAASSRDPTPTPGPDVEQSALEDLTSLSSAPTLRCETLGELTCPLRGMTSCPRPLSKEKLCAMLGSRVAGRSGGTPCKRIQEEFRAQQVHVGTSRKPITATRPVVPKWVATPEGQGAFRDLAEQQFVSFLRSCLPTSISKVHSARLLVDIYVEYVDVDGNELAEPASFWFFACSGNAQAGPTPFRINFVQLGRCDGAVEVGASLELLEVERRPHVVTLRSLPFGGDVEVGMFLHASFSDVIALCLRPGGGEARPHKLRFASIASELVGGDRFRVLGAKAEPAPLSVAAPELAERDEGLEAATSAGSSGELDWEAAALPRPKRRRQGEFGRNQKQGNERIGDPLHAFAESFEDLLGDPDGSGDFFAAVGLLEQSANEEEEEVQSDAEGANGAPVVQNVADEIGVPISPANCIEQLWRCAHPDQVFATLPMFAFGSGWTVLKVDGEAKQLLGKIRCIQGSSLRADCRLHQRCKLHLNISGHFAAADAAVVKWCIAGAAMGAEEHIQAASTSVRLFSQLVEELSVN